LGVKVGGLGTAISDRSLVLGALLRALNQFHYTHAIGKVSALFDFLIHFYFG
jgi:hypothetical protein